MPTRTKTAIPSATPARPRPTTRTGLVLYRLTVGQFKKMIDAGIFRDDHVELLGGLLVDKMVKNNPHDFAIDMLGAILNRELPVDWIARQEKAVVLGRFWRPEPDLAVARGPRDRYRSREPRRGDLGILIEVADTSYPMDRGKKWCKYAAAGIATYWIVNLPERRVEVYSAPSGRGKSATYSDAKVYGPDDEVPVVLEDRELGRLKVRDLLS
jgi:Uma2 family endonuclease